MGTASFLFVLTKEESHGRSGLVDPAPRRAHPVGGQVRLRVGQPLRRGALVAQRRLDAADQVQPDARLGPLRVSGVDPAPPQPIHQPQRRR